MRKTRLPLQDRLAARRHARLEQNGFLKTEPAFRPDGSLMLMFTTPCCGARQYDFDPQARICIGCGTDHTNTPVIIERNLDHCVFQAVSRYIS